MKIKTRIFWALLGTSLFMVLVGAVAVNRLQATAMVRVTEEARDLARVVSLLLNAGSNQPSASAQDMVTRLHQTQGREVVLTDANQIVLADAIPSRIGKVFTGNPGDEVGA